MWPNIIYIMPLLLTKKYSISCEIVQYFYDVRYWYIEIGLLDLTYSDVAYSDRYIVGPWWKGGAS